MSCDYIYTLASGTWEELGEPTNVSVSYISGWYVADSNIGKLNSVINTCYSGVSGCIDPAISGDEQAIYKEIYKINYYGRQIASMLNSANSAAGAWTELKDNTSSIRRANKNDLAKTFLQLQKDSREALKDLATQYNLNRTNPLGIDMGNNSEIIYKNYYQGGDSYDRNFC